MTDAKEVDGGGQSEERVTGACAGVTHCTQRDTRVRHTSRFLRPLHGAHSASHLVEYHIRSTAVRIQTLYSVFLKPYADTMWNIRVLIQCLLFFKTRYCGDGGRVPVHQPRSDMRPPLRFLSL